MHVLGRADNAIILGLHGARCPRGSAQAREAEIVWARLSDSDREAVKRRAAVLGAESVLGISLSSFGHLTTPRDRELYAVVGQHRGRIALWTARIRHERSLRRRLALIGGLFIPRAGWGASGERSVARTARHLVRLAVLSTLEVFQTLTHRRRR
ncbi:hypothetical protein BJF82_03270 [Kytococcus sp. CUA-901]|nr:hypothetical protein BJF82_03270 [Kytococcus sp. CUA-901]